jgi:hypothetical protein
MLDELSKKYPLANGEFIAIGWTNQSIGELVITPVAKQKKQRTVVLVHLSAGELATVRPDTRIFQKVVDEEQ